MTVKGAPDVVLGLCSHALWHGQEIPIDEVRKEICWTPTSSCRRRGCACSPSPLAISTIRRCRRRIDDPMAAVHDLVFVALVGIIDPLRSEAVDAVRMALQRRHRRPHDHGRPHRHRPRDRRRARPRPGRSHRDRAAASPRRRGGAPAPQPACVRPRRAGGQAEAGQADAAVGRCRGDDRRRRERRRGPQAGRHRGRDGKRLRGLQAGGQDRPHRRQLRDARASGRPRPRHLPQDHLLREAPADDPVLRAAAHGAGHDLQHQRRRRAVPDAAAVLQVLRRRHGGDRVHRRRPRSGRDATTAPQAGHADRQPAPDHPVAAQRPGGRRHRAARPRPRTGRAEHHARVGVDDDGVRRRGLHRREPRLRDAARARGAVVLAAVPLHGLDHPRLVPHLGGRRAPHAAAPARHGVPDRQPVGHRARPVADRAGARVGRQGDPAPPPGEGRRPTCRRPTVERRGECPSGTSPGRGRSQRPVG